MSTEGSCGFNSVPGLNSSLKINNNTQIVIQNNSDEISISKEICNSEEVLGNSKSSVPLKAQMLPVVYIKNNNVKIPFAATKTPTNNFIISPTTSSVFLSKPNNSISTISFNKQNVLIAAKGRNLVMPKSVMEHRPQKRAKVERTTTYVTMLKPIIGKPISSAGVGIHHLQNEEIKLTGIPSSQSSTTLAKQPQKFIFTGSIPMAKITTNSNNNKITPMPKVQTNRPSATVTTNCLQAGKFALLPMPVPAKDQIIANNNNNSSHHQQMINFQISDGKIISSKVPSSTTTVFLSSDTNNMAVATAPILLTNENSSSEILLNDDDDDELNCGDANNMTEKNDVSSKSYELSIAEEESSSNQSDTNKLMVSSSSADSNSSVEINLNANNNHKPNSNNAVKFAHGISILKKNYVPINTTTIPDVKMNECVKTEDIDDNAAKIIIPPSNGVEEKIIHTPSVPELSIKKPEKEKLNRRKSQFSLRKDFDEHDNVIFPPDTKLPEIIEEMELPKQIKMENVVDDDGVIIKDEIDIGDIKCEQIIEEPPFDPKTLLKITPSEEEAYKFLTWEDNVGSLPGSDLKFIQNEFGIIEYLSEGDYLKIMDKKSRKVQEKLDMEREVQCLVCSCYGIRADFIAYNYCSLDCQRFSKKISMKKQLQPHSYNKPAKKPRLSKTKSENDLQEFKEIEIGEDETSNDASQDKYSYPWECKKKGFSWSKYLLHTNTRAAPVKLFKEPFPYNRNGFKPGMKLEGVDPQHPSYFCVLTVTEILGYRIRLHFDGYPDSYDFWTYGDSSDIFPIGWCEKYGHELHPPPGYKSNDFNWLHYLKATKSTAAPKHLFVNRAGQAICPNGFRIGMKLEAVDKKNNSALICVATIRDMMDNRILVHFDGWDDIYDYWVDPTSPYIHPVGWSDQYGHDLTPPSDYSTPETFTWEIYLKETKSVAAPVRAFKQRPACGFKRGMRLECVDKRVPHIIRVATVDDVREHQIKILFDGWPNKYSYWVDDDCPDIHPIGWCQKTGHPLEPPLTPDDVYDFLECPTIGCRGLGHTNKMKYSSHSVTKYCPYSDANLEMDRSLPDRLLSPEKIPEVKEPLSIQPLSTKEYKTKSRLGKVLKTTNKRNKRIISLSSEKRPKKRPQVRKIKQEDEDEMSSLSLDQHTVEEKAQLLIDDIKIGPAERESWKLHSRFLNEFIGLSESPQDWSPEQVFEFISDIPGCNINAPCIIEHKIDGEALLQLNQFDILNILKFKVGPAIKLYNSIVILREKNCDKNFE